VLTRDEEEEKNKNYKKTIDGQIRKRKQKHEIDFDQCVNAQRRRERRRATTTQ
jgi:hypothetical protein